MPQNPKPPGVPNSDLMALVAKWRHEPETPISCPLCEAETLSIIDKSARPYAEWYAFDCQTCQWRYDMHVPLSGPMPGA